MARLPWNFQLIPHKTQIHAQPYTNWISRFEIFEKSERAVNRTRTPPACIIREFFLRNWAVEKMSPTSAISSFCVTPLIAHSSIMWLDDVIAYVKESRYQREVNTFALASWLDQSLSPNAEMNQLITTENKLGCFQYKVIHNILLASKKLYKMKLKTSPISDSCNHSHEKVFPLLYECRTDTFWQMVIAWWNKNTIGKCRLKVAQNSFQHIPRLTFWCVIITALYELTLQSWYQKTAQSLSNTLVLFSWHNRLP